MASVSFYHLENATNTTDDCSICRDSLNNTQCVAHDVETRQTNEKVKHIFHLNCLKDWFTSSSQPKCPLCQKIINLNSLMSKEEVDRIGEGSAKNINNSFFKFSVVINYMMLLPTLLIVEGFRNHFASIILTSSISGIWTQKVFDGGYGERATARNNSLLFTLITSSLYVIDPFSIRNDFSYAACLAYVIIPLAIYKFSVPFTCKYISTGENGFKYEFSLNKTTGNFSLILINLLIYFKVYQIFYPLKDA